MFWKCKGKKKLFRYFLKKITLGCTSGKKKKKESKEACDTGKGGEKINQ